MDEQLFFIKTTPYNQLNWQITISACRELLLQDQNLYLQWKEATDDDGERLLKLSENLRKSTGYLELDAGETRLAYSALIMIHNCREDARIILSGIFPENDRLKADPEAYENWIEFAISAFEDMYFDESSQSFSSAFLRANQLLGHGRIARRV